ncbi:GYD domain-containing protein [Geodermatophilus sp. CPCC 206100]|uniref:GYD domain-containing protein n=1 Tax=Geodermatophilus sp. CPCC 206100 TaxID=3020054 RepID=UPI003B000BAE
MPRYLFIGNYAPQGTQAIMAAGGTARRAAIEKMCVDLGGRLESFDFAFGTDDVYVIADLPDQRTAAAVTLAVNGSGMVAVRTVVLVTPEEMDAAGQVHADYRPPSA